MKRKVIVQDVILKDPNTLEPVIGQFSNGQIMQSDMECKMFWDANSREAAAVRRRIIMAKSSTMMYAGKLNTAEYATTGLADKGQTFIGILNNQTGKMKLIECSTTVLHPLIIDEAAELKKKSASANVEKNKEDFALAFGGKRAKKKIQNSRENKVDLDRMSQVLTSALKTVAPVDEDKLTAKTDSFADVLPPCDRSAVRVEHVYKLESIIEDDYLLLLTDIATDEYIVEHNDSFSEQLKRCLMNIKILKNNEQRCRMICAAYYMEFLIFLLKHAARNMGKVPSTIPGCPKSVKERIYAQFSVLAGKERRVRDANQDKLASHVIVLALLTCGFEVSLEVITASLGLRSDRIERIRICLGARFIPDSGLIVLKLPLVPMPKKGNAPTRKKRRN